MTMLADGRPLKFTPSPQQVYIELGPHPPDPAATAIAMETA
ncbi:MAG TPA: hypothetical protein VMI06_19865 [Terriglobia bacterium]|nr:hypothetical protein [Terriglobia bacterium]